MMADGAAAKNPGPASSDVANIASIAIIEARRRVRECPSDAIWDSSRHKPRNRIASLQAQHGASCPLPREL
jgi:hypothetical protein